MIRLIILFAIFFLFLFTGCSNSVGPTPVSTNDPRTYTWTIDTLFYESTPGGFRQTIMKGFWGLNDSLLYTVGFETNNGYGSMWKFNGKAWTRVHLNAREGGTLSKAIDLHAILGFAANDIYAFGTWVTNPKGYWEFNTLGLHFDGIQWREMIMPKGQGIYSAAAASPANIYCGGFYDGQLYHLDGSQWSVDTIGSRAHPELETNVNVFGISNTQGAYLQTEQWKSTNPPFLYQQTIRHENHLSLVLDSAYNDAPWGGRTFWQSKEGTIFSCGPGGIFRLSGDKWKSFYFADFVYAMYGTSEDHIFAVGMSSILFYNGKTWDKIASYLGTNYEVHVWCTEKQVFVSCCDGFTTYVFHGT